MDLCCVDDNGDAIHLQLILRISEPSLDRPFPGGERVDKWYILVLCKGEFEGELRLWLSLDTCPA